MPSLFAIALSVVSLAIATSQCFVEQGFSPQNQMSRTGSFRGIETTLTRTERCSTCLSVNRFHFEVKQKGKLVYKFALANETAQVDEIFPVSTKETVIFGRVNSNTGIVTRIDNVSGKPFQSFLCFKPSMSPAQRYVVFVKAYPNHFVEGESDEYLFLDLAAHEKKPAALQAFYPPDARNVPGDNVNVPPPKRHRLMSTGFSWLRNDAVAFADKNQNSIVLVLASFQESTPVIQVAELGSYEGLLNKCGLGKDAAGFRVLSISTDQGRSRFTVRFDGINQRCVNLAKIEIPAAAMKNNFSGSKPSPSSSAR